MFTNNKLAKSVRLAMAFGAAATALPAAQAFAAEDEALEDVERIQVTGSSIKRSDMEGALPVQVVTKEDIIRSGVTSVPELIETLPSMQGYTAAGESVGGGGGGLQTASLRDLGASYTLVLLNGRRMASATSGATVDVSTIPLSAIERVDILTDGASAVYGSDAIAGVINFILKKDVNETTITARFDKPQEDGGESNSFSITTGFGSLDDDGWNVLLAYSRDDQEQLKSVQRDFAKTGFLEFDYNGERYLSVQGSPNAIPGNAYISFTEASGMSSISMNPYKEANGSCHETSYASGSTCFFDYTSTLEIEPESQRDNFFLQGVADINDDTQAFVTANYSEFSLTSRIAPYPTGTFVLPIDSDVVQQNVIPHLTADQVANLSRVAARWRTLPGGNRTNDNSTKMHHVVAGIEGSFGEVDYDFAVTHSASSREDIRVTGYPLQQQFMDLVTSGAVNVFADPNSLSDEQRSLVKGAMYSGLWDSTDTSLFAIEAKASMPMFELPAGEVYAAFGFDYRDSAYKVDTSVTNKKALILFESPTPEFDLARQTYGIFAETVVPVTEELEITAAVRYDNIGAITNDRVKQQDAQGNDIFLSDGYTLDYKSGVKVNKDQDDITYKISAAYRPNDDLLLRASYGTGFKAPTMREIAEPRIEFGVTSVAYDCPLTGTSHPLAQYCYSDKLQYDVYREGYSQLEPEKATQMTVGFVYSPSTDFSVTMDYWSVDLEDQVRRITQDQIFGDPVTYADLYTTRVDPGTGDTVLAVIQAPVNIGKSKNEGLDWKVELGNEFGDGRLRTVFEGTAIFESENLRVGSVGIYDDSLGKVGPSGTVTFEYVWNFRNTYSIGDYDFTANVRYRSGYEDIATNECLKADQSVCNDVQLDIDAYILTDLLAVYNYDENLNFSFGIKNALDEEPPLTLNGDAGHQVGYDPRYTDAYGRTFYLSASYTF
jgi:iron complex outermembrane receptor protein